MAKSRPSVVRTLPLYLWVLLIQGASRLGLFSHRRRERLQRSADKRLNKLITKLEDVSDNSQSRNAPVTLGRVPVSLKTQKPAIRNAGPRFPFRILIVSEHAPTVAHAGGLRILDIIQTIKSQMPQAYVEVFTPAKKELYGPIDTLIQLADKVVIAPHHQFTLEEYLKHSGTTDPYFDVIDFQFPQPVELIQSYRKIGSRLIFTPMESHIRNEMIDLEATFDPKTGLTTPDALLEEEIINTVDQTICVSDMDCQAIQRVVDADVVAIETGISKIEFSDETAAMPAPPNSVLYVAYFGSPTNQEALKWYLNEVHPLVRKAVPDYTFTIVGRGDVSEILAEDTPGVNYIGEVDRIAPYIKGSTLGIAPALFGSGFRGKINQYAFFGVPTVASPLSADGLAYKHDTSILVAEAPADFANAIVELLRDPDGCRTMGENARRVAQDTYSWDAKWPQIAKTYLLPAAPAKLDTPSVHAIVPSYQHGEYIEERIRSIYAQEYSDIRVTVIDDKSTDGSHETIERLRDELGFDYIRNEKNSGSPFSAWEYAAQNTRENLIWICESDDAANPTLVPKLVKLLNAREETKIAYSGSLVVNEHGSRIGTTETYHQDAFDKHRWLASFHASGQTELEKFVRFGMVVPNMSSALIDTNVFRLAFSERIKSYRLAGDWLFLGQALRYGDIAFTPELLNRFRKHSQTSRHQTKDVRQIAEHASVRLTLSALVGASDEASLDAVKHDLWFLANAPDLQPDVLAEMESFDPASARKFAALLEVHLPSGTASRTLQKYLNQKAPIAA